MRKLHEGMRAKDLEDMVIPLISFDEYVSKISEEAVVIGFYVNDKDAANDLNRFLQKSAAALLDTDVSPAPDQQGYFLVFVEFSNTDDLGKNLKDVLHEVGQLTSIKNWKMQRRGEKRLLTIDDSLLARIHMASGDATPRTREDL